MSEKGEHITVVKRLKSNTGALLMDCKRALITCNWNEDKAIKYLRHYPISPPMDLWKSKEYKYCSQCDRFYVVQLNTIICDICENILE